MGRLLPRIPRSHRARGLGGAGKSAGGGADTEFSKRVAKGLVPTSADDGDKGQDNVAKLDKPVKPPPKKKG